MDLVLGQPGEGNHTFHVFHGKKFLMETYVYIDGMVIEMGLSDTSLSSLGVPQNIDIHTFCKINFRET